MVHPKPTLDSGINKIPQRLEESVLRPEEAPVRSQREEDGAGDQPGEGLSGGEAFRDLSAFFFLLCLVEFLKGLQLGKLVVLREGCEFVAMVALRVCGGVACAGVPEPGSPARNGTFSKRGEMFCPTVSCTSVL